MLYKKDSSNKVIQWSASPIADEEGFHIKIEFGEIEGKKIITYERNIKGKNIGKANATTPKQQQLDRIVSLYNRKKKQGYKTIEDVGWAMQHELEGINPINFLKENLKYHSTDENDNPKPMLCQQYYKASNKEFISETGKIYKDRKYFYIQNPYSNKDPKHITAKFPVLIQPKINGIRAMIKLDSDDNVIILGKSGTFYEVDHIKQIFINNKHLFIHNGQDVIFDGELYIPNESINIINSAVQATNLNTPRIEYHIFDLAIPDVLQEARLYLLKELFETLQQPIYQSIIRVATSRVKSDKEAQAKTDEYINQGYEGAILRNHNNLYRFGKRPMTMTKLKRTLSTEFPIIDIIPQDKNPEFGLFVCRTKQGEEFNVTPTDNADFKQLILALKHKYIGKQLTCVFYEYTDTGKPFHVIDCSIRDYD